MIKSGLLVVIYLNERKSRSDDPTLRLAGLAFISGENHSTVNRGLMGGQLLKIRGRNHKTPVKYIVTRRDQAA